MTAGPLDRLIAEAQVLAGGKHPCAVLGHKWTSIGGRACPYSSELCQPNCSQAVYVCAACELEDYGDPGGPAHRDCIVTGPCSLECSEAKDFMEKTAQLEA